MDEFQLMAKSRLAQDERDRHAELVKTLAAQTAALAVLTERISALEVVIEKRASKKKDE